MELLTQRDLSEFDPDGEGPTNRVIGKLLAAYQALAGDLGAGLHLITSEEMAVLEAVQKCIRFDHRGRLDIEDDGSISEAARTAWPALARPDTETTG